MNPSIHSMSPPAEKAVSVTWAAVLLALLVAGVTLRSAIEAYDAKILAVIMTGMGRDGANACAEIKGRGGRVYAQHEDGCVVYGMPKAVIEADLADRVLPLGRIAPAIVRHVKRSRS